MGHFANVGQTGLFKGDGHCRPVRDKMRTIILCITTNNGNELGWSSLMAMVGSALECSWRLAFSSAVSSMGRSWLPDEELDLDDLLPKLKPR